jgi:NDP-hexose-3-ketoreductase
MNQIPLNIGVMGCASIAERMVIPAILQTPCYRLKMIASRTAAKAEALAAKFGVQGVAVYEKLLESEEIDAVYMPLPTALHAEWALRSLEAGKHVLLEKSLACNLTEAETIVSAARKANRLVMENFMFVHHPQLSFIKSIVSEGRLGKIHCLRSSFGFPPFPDSGNIRYSRELGGGALLDAGAYTVKVSTEILGASVRVAASSLSMDPLKGVDIRGGIFLTGPEGAVIETAFGFDHFYQCSLEIWGNRGRLTANRIFTAGPGVQPLVILEEPGNTERFELAADNHFVNLLSYMAEKIRTTDFEEEYNKILLQASLLQESRDKALIHMME